MPDGSASQGSRTRARIPSRDRTQIMVVGLGMVGIGQLPQRDTMGMRTQADSLTAFIEKMLTLDTAGKYFIRTCGEEPTFAYNRVGLTGRRSDIQRKCRSCS